MAGSSDMFPDDYIKYALSCYNTERLTALIREVDGSHELGAAELAEKLVARGVIVGDCLSVPLR